MISEKNLFTISSL